MSSRVLWEQDLHSGRQWSGHVIVLISNCLQLNHPCNGYDPTPVRLVVWHALRGVLR